MLDKKEPLWLKLMAFAVYLFLAAPIIVVVFSSFSPTAFLKFPPDQFSLKWYSNVFDASNNFVDGFVKSLSLAAVATAIDIVVGVSASVCITKYNFKGKNFLMNFFTSPMFLPAITFGFVLLQIFSTVPAVPAMFKLLLGHLIIILPYIVRNVTSVMVGFNWTLEEAALSVGATPFQSFRKVTLPLIKPGIMAGSLLAFLYSFDDATLSAFLTDHTFITLPVRMMTYMEFKFDPTLAAISTLLILMSLLTIVAMEKLVGMDMFLK